jgi:hypothetical protein
VEGAQRREQLGEGVLVVELTEAHFALGVGVVPEEVRDLFEHQDESDRREQPLDHAGREERADGPTPSEAEPDLEPARTDDRGEEIFERPEGGDLGADDRRQSGGRSADARVGATQEPHEHAPDHARDQSRNQRRAGCERDPEAQRDRHEEHDEAGGQIGQNRVGG